MLQIVYVQPISPNVIPERVPARVLDRVPVPPVAVPGQYAWREAGGRLAQQEELQYNASVDETACANFRLTRDGSYESRAWP